MHVIYIIYNANQQDNAKEIHVLLSLSSEFVRHIGNPPHGDTRVISACHRCLDSKHANCGRKCFRKP